MTKLTERQIALLKHTFIDFQQTSEFLKNPLIIDRADGLYYWDTTGKKYFDAIGGRVPIVKTIGPVNNQRIINEFRSLLKVNESVFKKIDLALG